MTRDDCKHICATLERLPRAEAAQALGMALSTLHRRMAQLRAAGWQVPAGPGGKHRGCGVVPSPE